MTSLQKPADDQMTRQSWKAQKVFREISEWNTWVGKSLDNFVAELKVLAKTKNMPPDDLTHIGALQEQLTEFKKNLKPTERVVAKATGQRIRRAKRARLPQ